MSENPLKSLSPRSLWEAFYELTQIPRPSGHEERVCEWLVTWAKEHGFDVHRDEVGNVYVKVPASPGREGAPTVILQGHVDMVGEKDAGVEHDFEKDPIRVVVEGDKVTAQGTTLGADNGIGVAAALAAAVDPEVVHGPLELLFTIDEERGLKGAQGVQPDLLTGKKLLNLDSEDEAVIFVGCAGGLDTVVRLPVAEESPGGNLAYGTLKVTGLKGGHSGLEIHMGRGNAIKILARTLRHLMERVQGLGIERMEGGTRRNAIPRDAAADFFVPDAARGEVEEIVSHVHREVAEELATKDPDVRIDVVWRADGSGRAWKAEDARRAVDLIYALPHGVLGMSVEVPGVVETSSNLATVEVQDGRLVLGCSSRSFVGTILEEVHQSIAAASRLAGAEYAAEGGYPAWRPDMGSELLKVAREVLEESFGKPVEVTAIHAGLECGILSEKLPGVEMISFGPNIRGAHTPEEYVSVSSVQRFWQALRALLDRLSSQR